MPAGVGQPHVRIRELTVGGTAGVNLDERRRAAPSRRRSPPARATPRRGPRSPRAAASASTRARWRASATPAGAAWACAPSPAAAPATPTAPTSRTPAWPSWRRAAREAAAVADADEYERPARRVRRAPSGRPRLARSWPTGRPSAKVELALAVERAARAREGVTQVENAVYSDAEGSVALANSRGFAASLRRHPGVGLRVGVRRRGRRPDDRPRRGHGARPRRRSTRRRSAPRPPSARWRSWARASRRAGAARWCWTRSWPPRSSASSARCCPPTPSSAAARCSPAARARRWPTRRFVLADDGTDAGGTRQRPLRRRGLATRRTPLIEDGRLLGFLFDVAHRAQGRARDHRQRQPRLLPLAAVGRAPRT